MRSLAVGLGETPDTMLAQVIRPSRYGEPEGAFEVEEVPVPEPGPGECLVRVASAGINYNSVWAARGDPVDVVSMRARQGDSEPFHIGGSDASGVVWKVGPGVEGLSPGDPVVAHCGWWPEGASGILDPRARIWGYEVNYGSFAEFTRVQAHALMPKPERVAWDAAGGFMLCAATAYRMLHGHSGHRVRAGDVVLVWGGAGGLGCFAIQLARLAGALPVAVVSSPSRGEYCESLGAVGYIDRTRFEHWGLLTSDEGNDPDSGWLPGARAFGRAIWEAVGEKRNPRLVVEHPGAVTLPTSCYVCDRGGMVVLCAATTGATATLDLRYHWMQQKRLQGSHYADDAECQAVNRLVDEGRLDPCVTSVFPFEDVGTAHQRMATGTLPPGLAVARVGEGPEGWG